jgi:DNA polymerase-3 subunit beta
MKIKKEDLLSNLQKLNNIFTKNSALPILANILITEEDNHLVFYATDLDVFIKNKTNIKESLDMAICVNGKKFLDIIQSMPEDLITLTIDKVLKITSGKCSFKLPIVSANDYPKIPEVTGNKLQIDASNLKTSLSKVAFATAKDESRYALCGILFEFTKNKLNLVATDGKKLALATIELISNLESNFILPVTAINTLLKTVSKSNNLDIIISENKMFKFIDNGVEIVVRLIDAEFPNYKSIIPKVSDNKLKIKTKDICNSLNRANIMNTNDSTYISFELKNNNLTIIKDNYLGSIKEEIEASYSFEDLSISFDISYLLSILNLIDDTTVELEILDDKKPVTIRTKSYIYIILPMYLY